MKIKTSLLYFGKTGPPGYAPMECGCELQFCPRRKKGRCGGICRKNSIGGLLKELPV